MITIRIDLFYVYPYIGKIINWTEQNMWKLVNNNWKNFADDNAVEIVSEISEPIVEVVSKPKKTSRKSKAKVKAE